MKKKSHSVTLPHRTVTQTVSVVFMIRFNLPIFYNFQFYFHIWPRYLKYPTVESNESYAGAKLWNALPVALRNAPSKISFKAKLKIYLLEKAKQ